MADKASRNYVFSLAAARVDREAGVIRGVAVITEGPALGHGVNIDGTTLSQVKEAAATYANGLKVKMTHGGDAGDIIGYLTGFQIDGSILRADFHLLKSSPHREYVFEIAETIPDTFGMSISFSGPDEKREGKTFARCVEIYSCDLVAEPAANPTGLFSQPTPSTTSEMTPEDIKAAVDSALSSALEPMLARLSKLETASAPSDEEKAAELAAKHKANLELATNTAIAVIKQFNLAAPAPSAASAPAAAPAPERKFEEIVRDLKTAGKKHNDALNEAMDKHPAAHKDYQARVQRGDVIMF